MSLSVIEDQDQQYYIPVQICRAQGIKSKLGCRDSGFKEIGNDNEKRSEVPFNTPSEKCQSIESKIESKIPRKGLYSDMGNKSGEPELIKLDEEIEEKLKIYSTKKLEDAIARVRMSDDLEVFEDSKPKVWCKTSSSKQISRNQQKSNKEIPSCLKIKSEKSIKSAKSVKSNRSIKIVETENKQDNKDEQKYEKQNINPSKRRSLRAQSKKRQEIDSIIEKQSQECQDCCIIM